MEGIAAGRGQSCCAWSGYSGGGGGLWRKTLIRLDDNVAELLGSYQASQSVDRHVECLIGADRRLADPARRHIEILAADGVRDIVGTHAQSRHLLRIQPDPHAVVALAEDDDVRDALQTQQLIADVDRGVVADIEVVVAAVGRDEVHDHQNVGRPLANRDSLILHRRRQQGHCQRHAVLHHHQRRIQIGAHIERHAQRVGAVVPHLRGHVEHAIDAVDLLLDWRGDCVGHDLRAGAGVNDRHLDGGRRDRRILCDRQTDQSDGPGKRDDDRHHGGENRPIDEEMRKSGHGAPPLISWVGCPPPVAPRRDSCSRPRLIFPGLWQASGPDPL